MKELIKQIKKVENSETAKIIDQRLKEFEEMNKKGNEDWFSELCFCILTANSKAKNAINIQKELGKQGFICNSQKNICDCIKRNKHRFHNNKSKFIVLARQQKNIKDIIKKELEPREWLVKNIKGLGFKESSHFLRNVGYKDYAIVDRHIMNILKDNNLLKEKPKSLNKRVYLEIENTLKNLGDKINMDQARLDLYLWYIKTGEILK
jgi:N-glycosylase/DNA lyase